MGNDYEGPEAAVQEAAIKELRALSPEAKGLMNHHFGNSLQAVLTEAQMKGLDLSVRCVHHLLEDMETFGIRPKDFNRR